MKLPFCPSGKTVVPKRIALYEPDSVDGFKWKLPRLRKHLLDWTIRLIPSLLSLPVLTQHCWGRDGIILSHATLSQSSTTSGEEIASNTRLTVANTINCSEPDTAQQVRNWKKLFLLWNGNLLVKIIRICMSPTRWILILWTGRWVFQCIVFSAYKGNCIICFCWNFTIFIQLTELHKLSEHDKWVDVDLSWKLKLFLETLHNQLELN